MRNGGRIATALLLAVAFCATAPGALAETEETGRRSGLLHPGRACPAGTDTAPVEPAQPRLRRVPAFLDDRSLAARRLRPWRRALGALGSRPGGTRAQAPVRRRHLSLLSGALGNADVRGTEFAAAILPGWRFVRNGVSVTVFLGYDFQRHSLRPDDPSAGLRGNYHGARTGFELWYQPTRYDDDCRRRISVHRRAKL